VRKNNRKWTRHLLLAPMYWVLDHLTIAVSSFLTTVNEAHKAMLEKWTRKPVQVIRDAAEFQPPVESDPPVIPPERESDDILLTFVGKISNNRLDDLFQALPKALERVPRLRVWIVGDGPFRDKYLKWSQAPVFRKRIQFHDFVAHSRLPEIMNYTDIAYSDDWSDIGFPMKVYEYMHMGLAMLVQDTPAVREELVHEQNALLYKGPASLVEELVRLAGNDELRKQLGVHALTYAREHCRWEHRIHEFEQLYGKYVKI